MQIRGEEVEKEDRESEREKKKKETLDSKEKEQEFWSTAGLLKGIMTVILQSISSYSAQTA